MGTLEVLERMIVIMQCKLPKEKGVPFESPPFMPKLFDDMRNTLISKDATGVWELFPLSLDRDTWARALGAEAKALEAGRPQLSSNKFVKKRRQRERVRNACAIEPSASHLPTLRNTQPTPDNPRRYYHHRESSILLVGM